MITFVPLTGFLGAGKTTTMVAAAKAMQERGHKVAVITNDQGTALVDSQLARSALDAAAEVTGGCFCCRFDDLVSTVLALVEGSGVDTVIAEAVGSCTDLQATVVRPLRQYYGDSMVVTPLTTVLDPMRHLAFERAAARGEPESDLSYLFHRQLSEADVIALNKLDLIPAGQARDVLDQLSARYPDAAVVGYSAVTGEGMDTLLGTWTEPPSNADVDLDVDYDRYAAAEAQLAWLNQELMLEAAVGSFAPAQWARTVLEYLSEWADGTGAVIGHAKASAGAAGDYAKLSLIEAGARPVLDQDGGGMTSRARALINARIACEPEELDQAAVLAVAAADTACAVTSSSAPPASFKPGYPRPVHRLSASVP
jgi:Ni2+-binding GTPase involved in maturation of urease and hydrogenase